jgi:hypothetical protein
MSEAIKFLPRRSPVAAALILIGIQFGLLGCADVHSEKGKPSDATSSDSDPPTKLSVDQSRALPMLFDYDGSREPFPIPWLDANGSHNQMPGIRQEPSHIYHFNGLVARCNGFVGTGKDQDGNPVPFGTKTTDFGVMMGEHYTGRTVQKVALVHL